jgi:hypothetical protein
MSPCKLIFVQLNEINFDVVRQYAERHHLPSLSELLLSFRAMETYAESKYTELEPWIQWVSAQTGKTYSEHGVFRLGDIVNNNLPQVFELLEKRGLRVGALSPMNARNELKNPAYFVPDPWTNTPSDASSFSKRFTRMLRQTVNDNAQQKISLSSLATLGESIVRSFDGRGTAQLLRLIGRSRKQPWHKALVLDQLLHLVHLMLMRKSRPDVSFVFFNAGAHIQHHYFLNSEFAGSRSRNPDWYVDPKADPVLDMLRAYDHILEDYVKATRSGTRLIVATGLTQVPYDRVKFYYRLKDHASFLGQLGVKFSEVLPRMTRDFEIAFDDATHAAACRRTLEGMRLKRDGTPLFGEIEDRGTSLFVTLTYPNEIHPDDVALVEGSGELAGFGRQVAFVAIKNGMHSGKGFAFLSPQAPNSLPAHPVHVRALFDLTIDVAS